MQLKELGPKYLKVIKLAWKNRHQAGQLKPVETEFLPSSLGLENSPPNPLPRMVLWILISLIVLSLFWSVVGKVDIVASASGKIIPQGHIKYIQAYHSGIIKDILVQDGDLVESGQALVILDATITNAELTRLSNDYYQAKLNKIRFYNLLQRETVESEIKWESVPLQFNENLVQTQKEMEHEWQEYQSNIHNLMARESLLLININNINNILSKYQEDLLILKEKLKDYKDLYQKNFISQHAYLDLKRDLIEVERNFNLEEGRRLELNGEQIKLKEEKRLIQTSFKKEMGAKLLEETQKEQNYYQDLIKARENNRQTRINSPVKGYVTELKLHTVGGVVSSADPLMAIVPINQSIMAKVGLANKDVGFVKVNDVVKIKLVAFPFTKYGTIQGQVKNIAHDALNQEQKAEELIYSAYILLDQNYILVNGKREALIPGMMVNVEIKTGRERLINYFLNPLIQNLNEAFHER